MKKFFALLDLMRFRNPTGYLLLFFPCAFGVALAAKSTEQLWIIPIFLLGSITMRGAGCIVNDIVDRNIDALVERTKTRPIPSGLVSIREAVALLLFLMLVSLPILLMLQRDAIIIGLCSLVLVALYPWMKRITYLPQVFLGITFNIGALIAYTGLGQSLDLPIMLAYIGCFFWTLGYDTIYAFMDIRDDAKIGVKSSALFLRMGSYRMWIAAFYLIFNITMLSAVYIVFDYTILPIFGAICAFSICIWQVCTLDITSPRNCLVRFKSNVYVGILWMTVMIASHHIL
ncbi:MAG: 4-hydroxybenzoate octaprenyltransferase [Pseudomonadota bacterium]